MGIALVVAVGALLIALWVTLRLRRTALLFADPHLLELARGASRVRAAAFSRVMRSEGDAPTGPDDPRVFVTRAGLAIAYTISERDKTFIHHCSVGVVGAPTAHAVGGTFVLFAAKLLGLWGADLQCRVEASTVHHAELLVDAARHAALADLPIPELTPTTLRTLRREALEARHRVAWQRAPLDLAGAATG